MRALGAIIAGGQSKRFGSDKAAAMLGERTLLDHVAAGLTAQVDTLVLCGRYRPDFDCLEDQPWAGLGPLGGICAALRHAERQGYDAVFTAPCDAPLLPCDLVAQLSDAGVPSYVTDLPVVGLWSAGDGEALEHRLRSGGDRSIRRWAADTGARAESYPGIANVNTRDDLAELAGGG